MMPKPQKYPNSLRRHRKNAALRQREVALALGLNTTERISKWENGHSIPALWSLFQLAMLYHVSPQELYDEMYRTIVNPSASSDAVASEPGIPAGEYAVHP
jgi:transcriptional regulator with XRE-family HTH domain